MELYLLEINIYSVTFRHDLCAVCNDCAEDDDEDVSKLTLKGVNSIISLTDQTIKPAVGDVVHHTKCRLCLYSENKYKTTQIDRSKTYIKTRSKGTPFDYKTLCVLCGQGDRYSGKKSEFKLTHIRELNSDTT